MSTAAPGPGTGAGPSSGGVSLVDLSANPNIPELTRVLREVSGISDPSGMIRAFGPWISRRVHRDAFVSVSRRGLGEGRYKFTRILVGPGGTPTQARPLSDPWSMWDELEEREGGLVWDLISTPEPKLVNHADLTRDAHLSKVLGERAGTLKSIAAVPAYDNGEALNWALIFRAEPEWGDLEAFEMGLLDLNMMGTATRNLVSRRTVEALNQKLDEQFQQIGRIQRALIPASNPELEGYTLETFYAPSTHAGGDLYDYVPLPDGRLGVMIADVSGHGAAAATVMAMLVASIRFYGEHHHASGASPDPADAAASLNRTLMTTPISGMFATAFIAVLDPKTGTIEWVRCGHNPPRIRSRDGSIRTLDKPATLPLGISDDFAAPALTSTLEPGETLVLYTDGFTEARRDKHASMFGTERLDATIARAPDSPSGIIGAITDAVRAHTGSDGREDDQTLVVVRHDR